MKTNKVVSFEITWTFDQEYETGTFANGDPWVVGPVKIVTIDPPCAVIDGRTINGAMVNPRGGRLSQGYDSMMPDNIYSVNQNAASVLSSQRPLVLPPDSSLISTISLATPIKTTLKRAAILTVLSGGLSPGSFRPPYCGTDKATWNVGQLDWSLLRNLPPVPNTPDISEVAAWFAAPWLDHVSGWAGDQMHPAKNMPDYGREMHQQIGMAALMLHLDFPREQKETLLIRFVQLGIDLYGIAKNGGSWPGAGGHGGGRKWPILFAGLMLHDEGMQGIGARSGVNLYQFGYGPGKMPPDYLRFGEDDQTLYVRQLDVEATKSTSWRPDRRNENPLPYSIRDFGMPEWAIEHANDPYQSDASIWAFYRNVACPPFHGTALAALLTPGGKALWNHDAYFDYTDRYMQLTAKGGRLEGWWSNFGSFTRNMWDTYRDALPVDPPPHPTPGPIPDPTPDPIPDPIPDPPPPTKTCFACIHVTVCRIHEQAGQLALDLREVIGASFDQDGGVTEAQITQLTRREHQAALLGQRLAAEIAGICPLYETKEPLP